MDNTIATARPDVVAIETSPRPTAPPVRVPFSEVLSSSALALVQGAQDAVQALPGGPVVAAAVRAGGLGTSTTQAMGTAAMSPEGPTTTSGTAMMPLTAGASAGASAAGSTGDGNIEGTLAQSQQMNLYYLQVQEQVNDQNRTFTLLSNVIEMEHNTAKSAIGNIH